MSIQSIDQISSPSVNPVYDLDQEEIKQAIVSVSGLGLTIELCGSWVWVSGDTKPHKELLKEAGFRWAPKKSMWHFKPSSHTGFWNGSTDMETIRRKHGSLRVRAK